MRNILMLIVLFLVTNLLAQGWKANPPSVEPSGTSFQDSLSIKITHPSLMAFIYINLSNDNKWDSTNVLNGYYIKVFKSCTLKTYAMVECTGWCFSDTIVEYYSKSNTNAANKAYNASLFKDNDVDAIYDLSGKIIMNPLQLSRKLGLGKNKLVKGSLE
jgi:hypothetical protein